MGIRGGYSVGRIKPDPTEVLNMSLHPGMAGVLGSHSIGTIEMTTDIARRDAKPARRRDKDMGEVLADAAPKLESFRRGGRGNGGTGVEGDLAVEPVQ